jgi:uncharacterized protein (DUF2062 family)
VPPKDVAVAIAVEVIGAFDVPVVGNRSVRRTALSFDLQAIHLPQIDLPAVVAPKKVALAVAVEVAAALDVPIIGYRSVRDTSFAVGL